MFPDLSQPPGPEELAGWLQQDAVMLRDTCARIINRWSFIRSLGEEVTGEALFRQYNYLATPAQVYYGQAAQPEEFNFDDALGSSRRGL